MTTDQWLSLVTKRLQSAGLPTHYVQRTVGELADHVISSDDGSAFDDELTSDTSDSLADQFIKVYRTAKWYRRIPSLMWVLFPIPLGLAVCLSYYITGVVLIDSSTDALDGSPHTGPKAFLLPWLFYVGQLVTPLFAVYFLQKVMNDVGRPAWVKWAATGMLAFFFLATTTDFSVSTATQEGYLHLDFSDDSLRQLTLFSWSVLQVLIIWSVCGLDFVRSRNSMAVLAA